jgi:hypothetical protein
MAEPKNRQLFGIGAVAVIALLSASDRTSADPPSDATSEEPHEVSTFDLQAKGARYALDAENGRIVVTSTNGRTRSDLEMSLVIDGAEQPIKLRKADVSHPEPQSLAATFPLQLGPIKVDARLELHVDPTSNALEASVSIPPQGDDPHPMQLRISASPGSSAVFVPEHGELSDLGEVETRSTVIDDDVHPIAIAARGGGTFTVAEVAPEIEQPNAKPRLTATFELAGGRSDPLRADATILLGESIDVFWGALYGVLKVQVARVVGTVIGTTGRADVFALDEAGHALVRVPTSAGHFVVDAPLEAVRWYAELEGAHTSTKVARYVPGKDGDLRLEMQPGGELRVRVLDADTGLPVLARVVVRGMEGAVDPTFGHDFRASGAGPLVDVRSGEVKTRLPTGRYRVSALKGPEWSIDSEVVDMESGNGKTVELRPRHVVPTPGLVACDLHVHARPSFDSSVSPEDRLLSLASAGIDFAVPTEHNMVGDYTAAADRMDLKGQLAHVTGIEVTTYNPRIGHFGVFPYPKSAGPLPYRHATVAGIFAAARRGDPNRVLVVHHPRMPLGIGYFQITSFDPRTGKAPATMRTDFDVLEVYNGYEITARAKTEVVLADWFALLEMGRKYPASGSSDSHKIQFQWAGYPRTYVQIDPEKAGDTGAPIDPMAVVSAVKKGEGFVTSGPIVEIEAEGARPGGKARVVGGRITAHLRVRAAPWVDVSRIEIIAGGRSIFKTDVDARATVTGKEHGTFEEAAARAVRFDQAIDLTIPPGASWLVAIVRGDRAFDDVLPFMPVQPMGFTNPIWLE